MEDNDLKYLRRLPWQSHYCIHSDGTDLLLFFLLLLLLLLVLLLLLLLAGPFSAWAVFC